MLIGIAALIGEIITYYLRLCDVDVVSEMDLSYVSLKKYLDELVEFNQEHQFPNVRVSDHPIHDAVRDYGVDRMCANVIGAYLFYVVESIRRFHRRLAGAGFVDSQSVPLSDVDMAELVGDI